MLTLLHACTNVPLGSARLLNSFQQPQIVHKIKNKQLQNVRNLCTQIAPKVKIEAPKMYGLDKAKIMGVISNGQAHKYPLT